MDHQRLQQQQLLLQLHHQRQQAMLRFSSNTDGHFRTQGVSLNPNPNSVAQLQNQNQRELELAYKDARRVCSPDLKLGFVSIEDACERLLPYHVVADYEAEGGDRILDSDTTGQVQSRSQLWDNSIAAKVAELTDTFEKQARAFSLIYKKRGQGEFRTEERLMIERALFQEEEREKAGLEAKMRMAAMAQAQSQSHVHAEMMARAALRTGAFGSDGSGGQGYGGNTDGMMNGRGHIGQSDDEPVDDFLNDEEYAEVQDGK